MLNEVCSVGTECDEDVRVSDFVELYNPSGGPVDLSCFVLINRERVVFIPRGELASGKVRAWGEAELGFRITKADDEIELLKLGTDGTAPSYHTLETLPIREDQSHSFRVPDGGTWRYLELDEAEAEWPGSFNEPNPES